MQPRNIDDRHAFPDNLSASENLTTNARPARQVPALTGSAPIPDPTDSGTSDGNLVSIVAAILRLGLADGVAISERTKAGVSVLVSTDRSVTSAESSQTDLDQGPCLDPGFLGEIRCSDLRSADNRWPAWSAAAHRLGFATISTVRLYDRDGAAGNLTLYLRTARTCTAADHEKVTVAGIHIALELKTLRRRVPHPPVPGFPSSTTDRSDLDRGPDPAASALAMPVVTAPARHPAGPSHVVELDLSSSGAHPNQHGDRRR